MGGLSPLVEVAAELCETAAREHVWGEATVTLAPDGLEPAVGARVRVCLVCGAGWEGS